MKLAGFVSTSRLRFTNPVDSAESDLVGAMRVTRYQFAIHLCFRIACRLGAWLGIFVSTRFAVGRASAGRYEGSSSVFSPPDKPLGS